jgi:hypothetical protein
VCERIAERFVHAVFVFLHLLVAGPQAHHSDTFIHITSIVHTVERKNITIREDQAEWVEENHLNLSSFVQEKLDELIEQRES